MRNRVLVALVVLVLAVGGWSARGALGAGAPTSLTYLIQNNGTAYGTASGLTSVFPWHLRTGDRIFSRDRLLRAGEPARYDNEVCTVTFDNNDFCQTTLVLNGQGDLEVSWLWVGRNTSAYGPARFDGIINGGTGAYAHASGVFEATVLPTGTLQVRVTLD
jgi:hypothetical protein